MKKSIIHPSSEALHWQMNERTGGLHQRINRLIIRISNGCSKLKSWFKEVFLDSCDLQAYKNVTHKSEYVVASV